MLVSRWYCAEALCCKEVRSKAATNGAKRSENMADFLYMLIIVRQFKGANRNVVLPSFADTDLYGLVLLRALPCISSLAG